MFLHRLTVQVMFNRLWCKFWSSPMWSEPSGDVLVPVRWMLHMWHMFLFRWHRSDIYLKHIFTLFTFKTLHSCIKTNKLWTTRRLNQMRSLHHFITLKMETLWTCSGSGSVLIVDGVAVISSAHWASHLASVQKTVYLYLTFNYSVSALRAEHHFVRHFHIIMFHVIQKVSCQRSTN